MPSSSSCYKPVGAVTQTSLTSSAASTVTQAAGSTAFMVTVATNNVYWTCDPGQTAPSSTKGLLLIAASQPLVLPVGKPGSTGLVHSFQAAAGTATVNFQSLGD